MILTKAKLDEAQELEFQMEVFGTPEQAEQVRFVIESTNFSVMIPCNRDGQNLKVTIPKLKGILESGSYDVRMEVILDGRIFTPLKESIEFEPLVEFDVKKTKAGAVKEGVRITPKTAMSEDSRPSKNASMEQYLRQVMEEGFEVTKVNDQFVIKAGDLYAGIISENGIQKTKKQYSTFTELMGAIK